MLGYWVLIGLPILLSFVVLPKKILNLSLFVVGLIYILFIGLRYEVGADRWAYAAMYDNIASLSFKDALSYTEPSFAALNWLLAKWVPEYIGSILSDPFFLFPDLSGSQKQPPYPFLP
jgi:hypothetical protein